MSLSNACQTLFVKKISFSAILYTRTNLIFFRQTLSLIFMYFFSSLYAHSFSEPLSAPSCCRRKISVSQALSVIAAGIVHAVFSDPLIQKAHLLLGMEPMLPIRHDGQISMMPSGERGYRFYRRQVIMLTIQNAGGNIPDDWVFTHIAQIIP